MNICGRARPAAVAGIRKGKGTLAPFTFLTGLPEMQTSLSNACHAGYAKISRKNLCRRHLITGFVIVFPAKALGRHRVRINKYKQIEEPTQLKEKKYFLCMTFTICDLHVLMRIHAWNRAKLTREIQNFGGKQSVQMASAKKSRQTSIYYRQWPLTFQASSPSTGIGYRETSRETRGPPRSPTRRRGLVRRLVYLSRPKFVTKEGPRPRQPKQYSIYYRGDNATPHIFSFSEATVKIQQIRSSVDVSVEAL